MTQLAWDQVGEREFETGVDHGVLYIPDETGAYVNGVAWNGLTTVTESPSGAEATPQYADNMKYLNLISAEDFAATVEAFTYPDEFSQFDGQGTLQPGVKVGQQIRKPFGLCYRTRIGNDLEADGFGYKLHLVYGAQAAPSEKAYGTVNDSPAAIAFSWDLTTTPVEVTGFRPSAILTVDSTEVDADDLAALETILYGSSGVDPMLPLPDAVAALFAGEATGVIPAAPTYVSGTHTLTIHATTGVTYRNASTEAVLTTGDHVITGDVLVRADANDGYFITPGHDNDWYITY